MAARKGRAWLCLSVGSWGSAVILAGSKVGSWALLSCFGTAGRSLHFGTSRLLVVAEHRDFARDMQPAHMLTAPLARPSRLQLGKGRWRTGVHLCCAHEVSVGDLASLPGKARRHTLRQ